MKLKASTLRPYLAAVPVLLVNLVAFSGQFAWTRSNLPWPAPGQVLFSVTLESVAVYLAWHAHLAQTSNDSAMRLKLGAYTFAAVIGLLNYSHYAKHWHPDALAISVALMSVASPWLWGVHTRRVSRDQLMRLGLIDPHALRLGPVRWMLYPVRSYRTFRHAGWEGITSLSEAIHSPAELLADLATKADAVRVAASHVGTDPVAVLSWLRKNERYLPGAVRGFSLPYVMQCLSRDASRGIGLPSASEGFAEAELSAADLAALENGQRPAITSSTSQDAG